MPLTAAAGPITLAEHAAMLTLRDCTAFRTWLGDLLYSGTPASEAQAAARIYFDWPPAPLGSSDAHGPGVLNALRPFAVIWTPEVRSFTLSRIAAECWDPAGEIIIDLFQNVPPEIATDAPEVFRRFKNAIGQIISYEPPNAGLAQLSHTCPDEDHSYLAITRYDLHGPRRAAEEEAVSDGDFLHAQLALTWGGG